MPGMNRRTGAAIDGAAEIRQSIEDILTTPLGSRAMRPEYGSRLADMVDDAATPGTAVAMAAEVVDALARWEPRIEPEIVRAAPTPAAPTPTAPGRVVVEIVGRMGGAGETVAVETRI